MMLFILFTRHAPHPNVRQVKYFNAQTVNGNIDTHKSSCHKNEKRSFIVNIYHLLTTSGIKTPAKST